MEVRCIKQYGKREFVLDLTLKASFKVDEHIPLDKIELQYLIKRSVASLHSHLYWKIEQKLHEVIERLQYTHEAGSIFDKLIEVQKEIEEIKEKCKVTCYEQSRDDKLTKGIKCTDILY